MSVGCRVCQFLVEVACFAGGLAGGSDFASEGNGTVGMLLNNPDLYNSLTEAAVRLQRVLEEVQLLIEKLKAEGVQIKL